MQDLGQRAMLPRMLEAIAGFGSKATGCQSNNLIGKTENNDLLGKLRFLAHYDSVLVKEKQVTTSSGSLFGCKPASSDYGRFNPKM